MNPNCYTESEPISEHILEGLVLLALAMTTDAEYRLLLENTCRGCATMSHPHHLSDHS